MFRRVVVTPLILAGLIGVTTVIGSMAYLSLQRPETYQKIKNIPDKVLKVLGAEVSPEASETDTDLS